MASRAHGGPSSGSKLLDMRAHFQAKMQEEKDRAMEAYRIMNEERHKLKNERESIGAAHRAIPNTEGIQKFFGDRTKQAHGLPGVDVHDSPDMRKKTLAANGSNGGSSSSSNGRRASHQPAASHLSDITASENAAPRSAPLARKALPMPPAQRESLSAGKPLAPIASGSSSGTPSKAADPEVPLLDKIKRTRESKVETLRTKSAQLKEQQAAQQQAGASSKHQSPEPEDPGLRPKVRETSQVAQPIIASSKVIPGSNGRNSVVVKRNTAPKPAPAPASAPVPEEDPTPAPAPAPAAKPQPAPARTKAPPQQQPAPPPAAAPVPKLAKKPSDAELALEAHEKMVGEQKSKELEEQRQAEEEKKRIAAEAAKKKKAEVEERKKREEERKRKIREREIAREEARKQKLLEKERQKEEEEYGEQDDQPAYYQQPMEPEEPIPTMRNANANTSGLDMFEHAINDPDAIAAEPTEMAQCDICERRFAVDRLDKHREVCERAAAKKRKAFDVKNQRLQSMGSEAVQFAKQAKKKDAQYEAKVKKGNWKQQHEQFIAAIRAAKDPNAAPPPPSLPDPSLVKCDGCGRNFNPDTAEKHIPKCKERAQRDKMKKK